MKTNKQTKGFTLIELLVVIAIISLLAAIAVPNVIGKLKKAKMVKVEGDMKALETAVLLFYADTGYLPFKALSAMGAQAFAQARQLYTIGNLASILKSTEYYANEGFFKGGVVETAARNYLPDGIPLDPWRHKYVYVERDPRRLAFMYDPLALSEDVDFGYDEDDDECLIEVWLDETQPPTRRQMLYRDIDRDFYIWSWGQDVDIFEDDITNWEPDRPYAIEYK